MSWSPSFLKSRVTALSLKQHPQQPHMDRVATVPHPQDILPTFLHGSSDISLKQKLVQMTRRNSAHPEYRWLKNLEPSDFSSIITTKAWEGWPLCLRPEVQPARELHAAVMRPKCCRGRHSLMRDYSQGLGKHCDIHLNT